jgi:hypothetical protein
MTLTFSTAGVDEVDSDETGSEEAGALFDVAVELVSVVVEEAAVLPPHPARMRADEAKTNSRAEVLFFIVFPPYFFEKLSLLKGSANPH